MPLQTPLGGITRGLADERRHGHGEPVLRWGGPMADAWPHGPQSGLALPGWPRVALATMGHPGLDRIPEDAPPAGGIPARLPHGGGELGVGEPFGYPIKGVGRLRLRVPGKARGAHRRFDGVESQTAGVPGTCRGEQRAIGGDGPG
jgi:hypothetical protein